MAAVSDGPSSNTPVQQFNLTANIHYERQAFQDPTNNENLIGATVGENYLRNLPHKLVFTEFGNFLPAFNNSNAYSANSRRRPRPARLSSLQRQLLRRR